MRGGTLRRTARKNITNKGKEEHYIEVQERTLHRNATKNITKKRGRTLHRDTKRNITQI
jgi:hypothetical protein